MIGKGSAVATAPETCQMRDHCRYSLVICVVRCSSRRCFSWIGTSTNNQISPLRPNSV